jgi:hypothetical protein
MARIRQAKHWADPERLGKSMCGNPLENLDHVIPLDQEVNCTGCKSHRKASGKPKPPPRKHMVHWEDDFLHLRDNFKCRAIFASKTAKSKKRDELTCPGCIAAYDRHHGVAVAA